MRNLIAGFALLVTTVVVAYAQAPFADVPRAHWAYGAVSTLSQRGLVLGYPNGTFDGTHAMTRYEFAVAIARMLPQVEQSIKDRIASATPKAEPATDLSGYATKANLKDLLTRQDYDTLSKLVDQFAPELKMLQVDVAGIRRDIKGLTKRIGAIEKKLDRVKISGQMNVIGRGTSIERGSLARSAYPTDIDGRSLRRSNNLLDPALVYYDTDIGIRMLVDKGIYANTVLSIGNYLGGFASAPRQDFPYGQAGKGSLNANISPWKAYISAPFKAPLLGSVQMEAGKTGVTFTPYTLRLQDYDSYTNISKTDNGEYVFSGLKGKFKVGRVGFTAYAGTHGTGPSATGMPVFGTVNFTPRPQNPLTDTTLLLYPGLQPALAEWQQSAGVHAKMGMGAKSSLGLTYIAAGTAGLAPYFDGTATRTITAAEVYGADVMLNLPMGIGFSGEFSSSNLKDNTDIGGGGSVFPSDKHNAYDGRFTKEFGSLGLTAGYRQIDPFFGAPGSWGRLGSWKNPTNVKGFVGSAALALTSRLSLHGDYDNYSSVVRGVNTAVYTATNGDLGPGNALETSGATKLQHFTADLKYNITRASTLDLGMEQVRYTDLANAAARSEGGDPLESYYNFGLGSNLSDNTSLKLLYQIVDYRNHFLTNGENARGNVAVAQFQVKF